MPVVAKLKGFSRVVLLPGLVLGACLGPAAAMGGVLEEKGEYLIRAAGCVACHTDIEADGPYLAGGAALVTQFGDFYAPNITPHPETGIGGWNEQQFRDALQHGIRPDGSSYYPVFPYTSYSGMKAADVAAVFAYLQSVPAIDKPNRNHNLSWYVDFRIASWLWQSLFFEQAEVPTNRGEYLVKSLGHCDECHTPRDALGVIDYAAHLSGNAVGVDGDPVPNIKPDRKTGIGRWGKSEIVRYLRNGMLPDGDFAGGIMVDVIDEGLRYLTNEDREAIAEYLKQLSPVINDQE